MKQWGVVMDHHVKFNSPTLSTRACNTNREKDDALLAHFCTGVFFSSRKQNLMMKLLTKIMKWMYC